MNVSLEERESLHEFLDYLLLTRGNLESIDVGSLAPGMQFSQTWSRPRSEFIESASKFLRRVIGTKLHYAEISTLDKFELAENTKEPDHLAHVANAVRSFMPLFVANEFGENGNVYMEKMMEDFIAIYWGDEPRFFSTLPKNKGQHKRPFRIAYMRLSALEWELVLKEAGVRPFERQNLISDAYRTSWDAIRKWKASIMESFDLVPSLEGMKKYEVKAFKENRNKVIQTIRSDGEAYWAEMSQS